MQADVLGDTLRDGQPHHVRGEHERTVIGERAGDRAEQRVHTVGREHRQRWVTAHG
ncbi:hypothetical protein AB0J86_31530 [Micromonospora sp. NPDC049559]|uniref:hypothetical protein n=1 Tax=Micromonospora sp. NPDC049559 TaxID=3155923 RepID=UPI00344164CA